MKVPLNWLKEYVNLPKSIDLLCDKLTMAGHMLDKVEKIGSETVIDLELRGNRADCYSILGIAKEVAALFEKTVKYPPLFKNLKKVPRLEDCRIKVKSNYVKRVMAIILKEVKICPSPEWLAKRLAAYGIPTINNLVDLTNYVMVETGEPMHAFDLDLVKPTVQIRQAAPGEKMTTFEGIILSPNEDDLVWAKDKFLLSIAGAIGSKDYSILQTTKNVLLESANYDRANIRRSCQRHKLITEAGIRHEKELDSNLVEVGIKRFLEIFEENGWGKIEPSVFDYYPDPRKESTLKIFYKNIEELGGLKIESRIIKKIFTDLNIKIKKEDRDGLKVVCPTYRTDLIEEADLIEEVLRIYGYEKIPAKTLSLEIPPTITPPFINEEDKIRQALASLGFDEIISSPFVSKKYQGMNYPLSPEDKQTTPVIVTNPPSPDFQQMRMSLLPNLLEFTQKVIDERGKIAMFFEVSKIYLKKSKKYLEKRRLGLIFWDLSAKEENFWQFKGHLESLFRIVNLPNITFKESESFKIGFTIYIKEKEIALGGQIDKGIFYVEVDLEEILGLEQPQITNLWPKFPPIIEDLSFTFPDKTAIGDVIQVIKEANFLIKNVDLIDSFEKTRTFRITYQDPTKSLRDEDVEKIREGVIKKIKKKFSACLKT